MNIPRDLDHYGYCVSTAGMVATAILLAFGDDDGFFSADVLLVGVVFALLPVVGGVAVAAFHDRRLDCGRCAMTRTRFLLHVETEARSEAAQAAMLNALHFRVVRVLYPSVAVLLVGMLAGLIFGWFILASVGFVIVSAMLLLLGHIGNLHRVLADRCPRCLAKASRREALN